MNTYAQHGNNKQQVSSSIVAVFLKNIILENKDKGEKKEKKIVPFESIRTARPILLLLLYIEDVWV